MWPNHKLSTSLSLGIIILCKGYGSRLCVCVCVCVLLDNFMELFIEARSSKITVILVTEPKEVNVAFTLLVTSASYLAER